jgi:hypothetical protein
MKREGDGITDDGQPVEAYTLANAARMQVRILTFGCIIARLEVPDRDGKLANVVGSAIFGTRDYKAAIAAIRGSAAAAPAEQ